MFWKIGVIKGLATFFKHNFDEISFTVKLQAVGLQLNLELTP